MVDDKALEQHLRKVILEVCMVLNRNGIEKVPVGALMRLLGIHHSIARRHDDESIVLTPEFQADLGTLDPAPAPPGTVYH